METSDKIKTELTNSRYTDTGSEIEFAWDCWECEHLNWMGAWYLNSSFRYEKAFREIDNYYTRVLCTSGKKFRPADEVIARTNTLLVGLEQSYFQSG